MMVHVMIKDASRLPPCDPVKMTRLIIESADQTSAPKRIALGSGADTIIHKALAEPLAVLEVQKDLAFSTDSPATA